MSAKAATAGPSAPVSKTDPLEQFQWKPQPQAQALINAIVDEFLKACPSSAELARRMKHESGTRFVDWIDYIQVHRTPELRASLTAAGFIRRAAPGAPDCYVHDGGIFPQVVLDSNAVTRVAIKADSVVDFLAAHNITDEHPIEGEPMAQLRRALAFRAKGAVLLIVERHGYRGYTVPEVEEAKVVKILKHREAFRRRTRDWADDEIGYDHIDQLVESSIADLGVDLSCDLFFAAERQYWQRRNRAAQIQKARQDKLGLGWANHDHHTYRSSRHCFPRLIRVLERLGFRCRERFYAGEEAGWGAQVLEQPACNITIFADVDLSPDEVRGDFAHEGLPARSELGTVGLWCGLHGEAMLQAGMHHLECQFDFDSLRAQLEAAHIETMEPFTNFEFLRQAFTVGERWKVADDRIDRLLAQQLVTPALASQFRAQGAIGSHLENLERNDGYKGFNQHGVSKIIAKTDPRKQAKDDHELIGA
ncbi:MAG: hypothetical protein KF745_11585 [Phycisphaeraceae bacterium]|nr:hypothetical protein [Phycisphaeraceae bacterium]